MSLLQNEDFLIWQLRTSYLTHIKDGVGERLINVDSGILNDSSFRAAGWSAETADIKRTYSPPIPTAITSDYFAAPPRSAGLSPGAFGEEDEDGGMITGHGSSETVGPNPLTRKRRKTQPEEDDSSDLSDESDEDVDGTQRAAQQIRFAKMPVRTRSGSSPIRNTKADGPELLITSPSRRSGDNRLRRGSLGAVEAVKQRARRDTTTSSEMSSENELDPSVFKRRQINPTQAAKSSNLLAEKHKEDERQRNLDVGETIDEDSAEDSDGGSLSSEFAETADSGSLLDDVSSPLAESPLRNIPQGITVSQTSPVSPKKSRNIPPAVLQALPPPRPISTIQPVSALGQAIRARQAKPTNPVEAFARLSGKGALDPLNIRIYAPFSDASDKPFDMPLQRTAQDDNGDEKLPVKVADAIGLCLWRYHEEGLKPPMPKVKQNVNRWTLRMIDDGEVEYDFPALARTSPMVDFTLNNNRSNRGRQRGKAYDEFALVEATESQFKENQISTPKYNVRDTAADEEPSEGNMSQESSTEKETSATNPARLNPIIGSPFSSAVRKTSAAADKPLVPTVHSTPRMGQTKMLKMHFTSPEAYTQSMTIEVTTDTYIAEVLDIVCKRWNLDKAHHFLRVTGTNTIAPLDRTVESLGIRTDLDLIRRRFAYDGGLGVSGSPGSSSPNAPLLLTAEAPKKGRKGGPAVHPLSQKQDLWGNTTNYKKYSVIRKQPMSFTPSHQRTLLMDGDYLHILPAETGRTMFDTNAKTTTIPFGMIVGCKVSRKHPKSFRVVVFRERETKRYDFEASSHPEATEIVREIEKGMEPFRT